MPEWVFEYRFPQSLSDFIFIVLHNFTEEESAASHSSTYPIPTSFDSPTQEVITRQIFPYSVASFCLFPVTMIDNSLQKNHQTLKDQDRSVIFKHELLIHFDIPHYGSVLTLLHCVLCEVASNAALEVARGKMGSYMIATIVS